MSSVSKLANGRYRARYRDPQSRTRSKTFELKADAERFLTGVEHRKLAGGYVDPAHGRLRFDDWVARWRAGVVDLRPSTLARDDGYVQRYLIPHFGAVRIGEIDHARVQACRLPVPWDHPVATRMGPPRVPRRPAGVIFPTMAPGVK